MKKRVNEYVEDYSCRTKAGEYLTTKGTWAHLSMKTAYFATVKEAKEALRSKQKGYVVANVIRTEGINNLSSYVHREERI